MGQKNSKMVVTLPPRILCFPLFPNEDKLLAVVARASAALPQVRGVLSSVLYGLASAPAQFSKAKFLLESTGKLFNFILDRISESNRSSSQQSISSPFSPSYFIRSPSAPMSPVPLQSFTFSPEHLANVSAGTPTSSCGENFPRAPANSPAEFGQVYPKTPANSPSGCGDNPPTSPTSPLSPMNSFVSISSETSQRLNRNILEEALVQAKIDKSIAKSSVCELRAKIVAIRNRFNRLLAQISMEDRKLEVVPAFTLCEEVLELFRDPEHVFWKNPLITAPFLVTFAGIYNSIAEIGAGIIPSYTEHLGSQIDALRSTLQEYKQSCIERRTKSIKILPVEATTSMMEGALGMSSETRSFYIADSLIKGNASIQCNSPEMQQNDANEGKEFSFSSEDSLMQFSSSSEALDAYKKALRNKYDEFFESAMGPLLG